MTGNEETLTEEQQMNALTVDVIRAYAAGDLTWSAIREHLAVLDFGLVLRRLSEENLRLPRAPAARPTLARAWLRDALTARPAA